jgi:hypothetical protein
MGSASEHCTGTCLPDVGLPLEEEWKTPLASRSSIWTRPHQSQDSVVVRCGHLFSCLELSDGRIRWERAVGTEDLDNMACMATRSATITEWSSGSGHGIVCLSWRAGEVLWQERLEGEIMDEGLAVGEDAVYAISAGDSASAQAIHLLEPETGTTLASLPSPSGANHALATPEGFYFGSRSLDREEAGLYVLAKGTDSIRRVHKTAVGLLRSGASRILAVTQEGSHHRVVAFAPETMEPVWSERASGFVLDADAGHVAHIELAIGRRRRLILRKEETGDIVWKAPLAPDEPLFTFFTGSGVCVQYERGLAFFDRADGSLLGELFTPEWTCSWGAAIFPNCLVIGHGNEVICYRSVSE